MTDFPFSSATVTELASCVAEANRTPVEKLILRRRKARSSALDSDSSSAGTSRGRPSTIVTSAPNDFHTEANSTPMTPPPRTTADLGIQSSSRAWSLVMIRPPISSPGRLRAYDPLARTTFLPVYSRPSTVTVRGPVSRPSPSM